MSTLAGIEVDGRGYLLRKGGGWLSGVDVSHHQKPGKVNTQGIDFLVARATYGDKPDATFQAHVADAKRTGSLIGAYLFYRQTKDRQAQLDAFYDTLEDVELDIVPALDLEWNTDYDGVVQRSQHNTDGRWIAERLVERFGGVLIYTAPFFWSAQLGSPEWCTGPGYHFWLAHYTREGQPKLPPDAPANMRHWAIHQWQGAPLDRNVANYLPAVRREALADTDPAPPLET